MYSLRLYDYQQEMLDRLMKAWKRHRSVMVQMPTGTGKTHLMAEVIRQCIVSSVQCLVNSDDSTKHSSLNTNNFILIVAHRRELLEQIRETLDAFGLTGENVKVESIQKLSRHIDEECYSPSLVVIDEAHHALAKTYRVLWEKWQKAKFLGLTATPCRMNRWGFTDLFDTLITSWSIAEFIRKGYLSPFDYVAIRPDSEEQRLIDLLEKRGADGDYQIKEMNRVLNRHTSIERLYSSMEQYAKDKKGIVYAISILHARAIADYYTSHGVSAVAIDSNTPADIRREYIERFKDTDNSIRVLVNVDIFSEGFDCPDVEFVQMARPTLSLAKYLQQVGRGLRKSEDKKACILIDNVGLCRVFGLPTVEWKWESMFRGLATGKGRVIVRARKEHHVARLQEGKLENRCDMEVIVSHEKLLSEIDGHWNYTPMIAKNTNDLKVWQDAVNGLWGLRRGRTKTMDARFANVFDVRYDMAAVKFSDNSCGVVDGDGNILWKIGYCLSMKFAKSHFLHIVANNKDKCYLDLYSFRLYHGKPEIKRYGNIELLKLGKVYYSRTKEVYESRQDLHDSLIYRKEYYLAIYDRNMPFPSYGREGLSKEHWRGFACILEGDYDRYYWKYRILLDGSMIVADSSGKYYHVQCGMTKEYIGCRDSVEDWEKCQAETYRRARMAEKKWHTQETEKSAKRLLFLAQCGNATPFQAGMKWGLRVGDRITVPPVYRNIKSPVGKYCAVEKNHSQWGVVALDGTLMVEPQYSDIEINMHGIVTGTKVTGNTEQLKLP